jgi:hypothetical protein
MVSPQPDDEPASWRVIAAGIVVVLGALVWFLISTLAMHASVGDALGEALGVALGFLVAFSVIGAIRGGRG